MVDAKHSEAYCDINHLQMCQNFHQHVVNELLSALQRTTGKSAILSE